MHKPKRLIAAICLLLLVMVSGAVMANEIRINPPPYHFGGDALFCEQGEGCRLLDKDGNFLWSWSQDAVDAAFAAVGDTGANTQVAENGEGTYGIAQLWALPPEVGDVHDRLCFFGFDEWGKDNFMCFIYSAADKVYLPVGVTPAEIAPEATPEVTPEPVADCSMWTSGRWVRVVISPMITGPISSIDSVAGTVTFNNYAESGHPPYTASCDAIEAAPG